MTDICSPVALDDADNVSSRLFFRRWHCVFGFDVTRLTNFNLVVVRFFTFISRFFNVIVLQGGLNGLSVGRTIVVDNLPSWSTTSSPGAFHSFSSKTSTTTISPFTARFIFSRPASRTGLLNAGTGTLPYGRRQTYKHKMDVPHLQVVVLVSMEVSLVKFTGLDPSNEGSHWQVLGMVNR
jgi:hypothetical protein